MKLSVVIMAGGSGSRLWPISRSMLPKQFLPLVSNKTMLQETLNRIQGIEYSSISIICNEEHRFYVAEQLREMNLDAKIILEPESKNTAPALCLAALNEDSETLLLVLSADHIIINIEAFHKAIHSAINLASSDSLVTFGVTPNKAHTGYGYIKKDNPIKGGYKIAEFVEKPNLELANTFFASGNYLWNSGMFVFRAGKYIDEVEKFSPTLLESCSKSVSMQNIDKDFIRVEKNSFSECPNISLDYAVMEKTNDSSVVELDAGWSDVGSWSSLWEIIDKDLNGNVGKGDIIFNDTKNSYVSSEEQLVAVSGLEDVVVISTKDSLLVSSKNKSENVKLIIDEMKTNDRKEVQFHREVFRPWGKYDSILSREGYQVKLITVKPGEKLSVQMHYHRSEHWIVVSGIARVHYGQKAIDLSVNESTYHDKEVIHSLENPGDEDLELIEVQVGGYLGEDDIVRYEDIYGRN